MKFSLYIALRYFFSKKSFNIVNIISLVSVFGVTISTFAFIVVLSVFNGLEVTLSSLFNSFDSDFKVTTTLGKTFVLDSTSLLKIDNLDEVTNYSKIIEENALVKYGDRQGVAVIKGVDNSFQGMTQIDNRIIDGYFKLNVRNNPFAVLGIGIAAHLSVGLNSAKPLHLYAPRKDTKISMNPNNAFHSKLIYPIGIFSVQQEYDTKYIIVPIDFAEKLFGYTNSELNTIEINVKKGVDIDKTQKKIQKILGSNFTVKNKFEQHELFWKTLKSEKLISFLILSFILIIACFNIIGTMSILIIEKKQDIITLECMGANKNQIKNIFITEGCIISLIGLILGILLGIGICWLQIKFGLIAIEGMGAFVIDYLPVEVRFSDITIVIITVLLIGFIAPFYAANYVLKKYINIPY